MSNYSFNSLKLSRDTLNFNQSNHKQLARIHRHCNKTTTDTFACIFGTNKALQPEINKKEILWNSSRIAILSTEEFAQAIDIIKWMQNNKIIADKFDIVPYDTSQTTALIEMTKLINKGYKCIIGCQGSDEVHTLINLLTANKAKILYFNSYSTSTFQNNLELIIPQNVIRTALLDDEDRKSVV